MTFFALNESELIRNRQNVNRSSNGKLFDPNLSNFKQKTLWQLIAKDAPEAEPYSWS